MLERASLGTGRAADDAGCLAWTAAIELVAGRRATRQLGRAQRALDLASREGDDKALATAYTVLTMLARVDGDHVAHHRNYARALEHAERAKDLLQLVRIRCNNGSHLAEDGEYDKALAELDVATRLADLGGYGMFRGLCLTNRAEALIATGRLDEAVSDLEAARVDLSTGRSLDGHLSARPARGDLHGPRRSCLSPSPPSNTLWRSPRRPSRCKRWCRRSPVSRWRDWTMIR